MGTLKQQIQARTLATEVMRYAQDHYNKGGWDFIVECETLASLEQHLDGVRSISGAVKKIAKEFSLKQLNERRAFETLATAF